MKKTGNNLTKEINWKNGAIIVIHLPDDSYCSNEIFWGEPEAFDYMDYKCQSLMKECDYEACDILIEVHELNEKPPRYEIQAPAKLSFKRVN